MTRYDMWAAVTISIALFTVAQAQGVLYPNVSDNSHASPELVTLFDAYFTGKSSHNATAWLDTFDPDDVDYYDSTLGAGYSNRTAWVNVVEPLTQLWQKNATDGRSYPLRLIGDTIAGAVINFVDTASLFGAELRILSSVDFVDGKIRRQVDYWDGRGNPVKNSTLVPGDSQYPYDLGLSSNISELAADAMVITATNLNDAFASGNATAAAALFDYNAVFEDLTLRARIEGQSAISAYLSRVVDLLPYGPGTTLHHVLGNAMNGGYEWRPANFNMSDGVRAGITALELDASGNITSLTAMWDGSRLNKTQIQALAILAPTP